MVIHGNMYLHRIIYAWLNKNGYIYLHRTMFIWLNIVTCTYIETCIYGYGYMYLSVKCAGPEHAT